MRAIIGSVDCAAGEYQEWRRVIQAGAVSWFYDGPGGNFEYWPEGLDGPMLTEQAPSAMLRSWLITTGCITALEGWGGHAQRTAPADDGRGRTPHCRW
jgi:hypothetical protein